MRAWGWIHDQWHKVIIALLAIDHLWDRIAGLLERFRTTEDFIERRTGERRHTHMELKQLAEIPGLVPEVLQFVADVKAVVAEAQGDPKFQKLLTDGEALEARVKAIFGESAPASGTAA